MTAHALQNEFVGKLYDKNAVLADQAYQCQQANLGVDI